MRNGVICVISHNLVALGASDVTSQWLKLNPYCLQQKYGPKNLVLAVWLMTIFSEITEKERVKKRYPHLKAQKQKIWLVQHCVAVWETAEILFMLLWMFWWVVIFTFLHV